MKILFCAYILLGIQYCFAQSNTVVSGGNAAGSGGLVNYTIGQIDYNNVNSAEGSASQGLQHAFEIATLGVDNFPAITLNMLVYPNPTTSKVTLKIENYNFKDLTYMMCDLQGRQLLFKKIVGTDSEILLDQYPVATYFLMVLDQNETLKTFKIIKNN